MNAWASRLCTSCECSAISCVGTGPPRRQSHNVAAQTPLQCRAKPPPCGSCETEALRACGAPALGKEMVQRRREVAAQKRSRVLRRRRESRRVIIRE
eukprot:6207092-Pleurochrysis_carterae.AAC.3